jgi:UDP-4-keto-D-QuiNAc 4-reductase
MLCDSMRGDCFSLGAADASFEMTLLITGASGFVGTALTKTLAVKGLDFVPFNRADNAAVFTDHAFSAVVHLAARVHVMNESPANPLDEFRQSNMVPTLALARRAAAAGVQRFVYVSSVKVNGEQTYGTPFAESNESNANDPYGISKHEAEQGLRQIARETGMEVVIVRPPLVYGAGVKANFAMLTRLAGKGIPLPLGAVHNQRSMVYVGNLVDFLILCAQPVRSPLAANETFLISDGQDVSTTLLLKTLAKAQGKTAKLIPVPAAWLAFALKCMGKSNIVQRLLGDLQVDSSKARTLLGWQPPFTVEQGLAASVGVK